MVPIALQGLGLSISLTRTLQTSPLCKPALSTKQGVTPPTMPVTVPLLSSFLPLLPHAGLGSPPVHSHSLPVELTNQSKENGQAQDAVA